MKLSAIVFSIAALLVPVAASADTHCGPAPQHGPVARWEVRQEIRHDREVMRDRMHNAARAFHREVRDLRRDVRR